MPPAPRRPPGPRRARSAAPDAASGAAGRGRSRRIDPPRRSSAGPRAQNASVDPRTAVVHRRHRRINIIRLTDDCVRLDRSDDRHCRLLLYLLAKCAQSRRVTGRAAAPEGMHLIRRRTSSWGPARRCRRLHGMVRARRYAGAQAMVWAGLKPSWRRPPGRSRSKGTWRRMSVTGSRPRPGSGRHGVRNTRRRGSARSSILRLEFAQ